MSDKEMTLAIAKICDGKCCYLNEEGNWMTKGPYAKYFTPLTDLNDMAKVEEYFNDKPIDLQSLYYDYVSCICGWVGAKTPEEAKWSSTWNTFRAKPKQRAEAFLRALKLWVD